jgi:Zn-dependent protease with chaperone function/Zn-finger nucleic acid-binding protein
MSVVKTVFQIEREARWRVWALFALLWFMVYLCVWVVVLATEASVEVLDPAARWGGRFLGLSFSLRGLGLILAASVVIAVCYWFGSRVDARDHLVRAMHARPLDPADRFHQRLADIVEEMRIATGGPAIRCLTVPTVGMNAFVFSDLHGAACIGVTEGALSRLSRQQLEAVVAHEFGHVLSGDYVTATSACLLFGVYTSLGDSLDGAMIAGVGTRAAPLLVGAVALRALLGLLQMGSAVANAAISRQRERVADLAAVRYTRDPLSLAQALQMMVRHSGGGGYIPDGLSALCIRPTDLNPRTMIARAMATHPPVNDRIVALLNLAHVSWDNFQAQAVAAETAFQEREHVTQAPGAAAAMPAADQLAQVVAAPLVVAAPAAAPLAAALGPAPPASAVAGGMPPAAASPVAAPPPTVALPPTVAPPTVAPPAAASPVAAPPPTVAPPVAASSLHTHGVSEQAVRCPGCGAALERCDYEGTTVLICRSCGGRVATTSQVQRMLTRREMRFDERQQRLADYVVEHGDELRLDFARRRKAAHTTLIACPRCGRSMLRRHFSYNEAVEIDYCTVCDLFWFEKDELEVLQAIVERQAQ